MIRVNLLQNRGMATKTVVGNNTSAQTGTDFGGTGAGSSTIFGGLGTSTGIAVNRNTVTNLIALLILPVLFIFYERYQLGLLNDQLKVITSEQSQIQNQLTEKKAEIAKHSDLKERATELANKIEIMKKLARLRLREIKALDFMQTMIPEKVWLRELSFRAGALKIKGYAMTDDDLTLFVRTLEKSRNFSAVVLQMAKEERNKEGAVKNFEVSCNVEAE